MEITSTTHWLQLLSGKPFGFCRGSERTPIKKLANHKMAADVTAGCIVSDVERLRDLMNKIHKFTEDRVGKDVLDLSDKKKPKVLKAEPKKKAKARVLIDKLNYIVYHTHV